MCLTFHMVSLLGILHSGPHMFQDGVWHDVKLLIASLARSFQPPENMWTHEANLREGTQYSPTDGLPVQRCHYTGDGVSR